MYRTSLWPPPIPPPPSTYSSAPVRGAHGAAEACLRGHQGHASLRGQGCQAAGEHFLDGLAGNQQAKERRPHAGSVRKSE